MGRIVALTSLTAVALAAALSASGAIAAEEAKSVIETGNKLAFDNKKGNCLACHVIEGGASPGTIGPPLVAMQMRYPDKAKLRAQIWDASRANANTSMPPFGRHGILTDQEIDAVAEFVWTL